MTLYSSVESDFSEIVDMARHAVTISEQASEKSRLYMMLFIEVSFSFY